MAAPALTRILYVDDDADIRTVACLALEQLGAFTVKPCASGEDALACATDFAPDLVVLDVMMPAMDGRRTLRRMRELPATRSTPVVFMTARTGAEDLACYRELGAAGVILKPFDPMTLCAEVRKIWAAYHDAAS